MAIILDANVLPADTHIDALGFSAVRAVAHASGHPVLVPEIAFREAVARREREIQELLKEAQQLDERWRRMGIQVTTATSAGPAEYVTEWERQLRGVVEVLPTPTGAAAEAIDREIHRIPPTRDGRGARDAVIWLTVRQFHRDSVTESYFVSQNTKDFADPASRVNLHPNLLAELSDGGPAFYFCNSTTDLLGRLSTAVAVEITASSLATEENVRNAIAAYVSRPQFLSRILVGTATNHLFVASPVEAGPLAVSTSSTYRAGGIDVSVTWTRWRIGFTVGVFVSRGNRSFSQELHQVELEADLQLWLRRQEGSVGWAEAEVSAVAAVDLLSI